MDPTANSITFRSSHNLDSTPARRHCIAYADQIKSNDTQQSLILNKSWVCLNLAIGYLTNSVTQKVAGFCCVSYAVASRQKCL